MTGDTSILGHLTQFRTRLRTGGTPPQAELPELPLRAELFSADQMERHGQVLAASHRLSPRRDGDLLLPRLAHNEAALIGVCARLTTAVSANHRIGPAGEWLLDNFHLIEEQIATAKRHLPRGYSRELPRPAHGPSAGRPRVYDIALETISHGDGRVDAESLHRFVTAYQSVTTLNLGELWAIPIMLRLALIENLRRVGVRLAAGRADRDLANAWADRMIAIAERDPKSLILVVADMARSLPPMGSAFVAELARRLQGRSAALALALTWIEQRLAESHLTIEQSVQAENRQQASDQVSISNSFGSLRFLSAIDWREFVESVSLVEQVLRQDPRAVYGAMEFSTRDRYRHAVERIARQGRLSEVEVAAKALELARQGVAGDGSDNRNEHVGYHLIGQGLSALERSAGVADSMARALRSAGHRFALPLYLGAVALLTGLVATWFVTNAVDAGTSGPTAGGGDRAVAAGGQSGGGDDGQLAGHAAGEAAAAAADGLQRGHRGAGADARGGANDAHQRAQRRSAGRGARGAVPGQPGRPSALRAADRFCRREASNRLPADAPLLDLAAARIADLNRKYGSAVDPPAKDGGGEEDGAERSAAASAFYLFHRARSWNANARVWMGRERKRGKLGDLNALLRGGDPAMFALIVGALPVLADVKYVITLDTDTQLPRDAARQFVGAMMHPLNMPRFDESRKDTSREVVTSGYGILQPRVSVSLPGTNRSRYARLYGGEPGIDQYTRAVSDVYQDVFGEGSFIGKGIYDVDAFERSLKGRFPANRVLSHDLLEGCYARAGLLSDAELYEEFPARYAADVARRRRWIRGDWQLTGWLRQRARGPDGRRERNPLSMLSQWKVFDNLRRSLVPAALATLLLLGWTTLASAWIGTALVLGVLLLPSALAALGGLAHSTIEVPFRQRLAASGYAARRNVAQALLALAFLPYEAYFSLDAIVRTVGRTLITRRRLLEWRPSGDVDRPPERHDRADLLACYREMAVAPVVAAATCTGLALANAAVLAAAGPILLLWGAAPAIAWWISRPLVRRGVRLSADQTRFLRALARKTWAYFERYVGAEDHWLPPDNVQDRPKVQVAHRTSPTNMGLALLSNLAAHDFGYVSTGRLMKSTTLALRSMESLERHRGHFYNWYDTQTRLPLAPLYVSTVDSGNLAGHLLTFRAGIIALIDEPILNRQWLAGVDDTFRRLAEAVGDATPAGVAQFAQALDAAASNPPIVLADAWLQVKRLAACADDAAADVAAYGSANAGTETAFWGAALARHCTDLRDDLLLLAPWLAGPALAAVPADLPGTRGIPTLRAVAKSGTQAKARIAVLEGLALQAAGLSDADYGFLFDKVRRQLVIGYNVAEHRRDTGYYDLLASEARLCNFFAIAQGKLPQESWFALGRLLCTVGGEPALLSWSGSMFEYLMPLLVMPSYENTLLDQTYRAAVARQIEYGRQRGVPWGMSESGYNVFDVHLNYQYRAFGVPGLGLKRGLAEDLVVAPYASALALMVAPDAACQNLQRLAAGGLAGSLGLYEAIDYTPSRQRRGETSAVVRSYMAHHQAMSLLAIAFALLERPMQKRFESDLQFQATLLLLQERVPRANLIHSSAPDLSMLRAGSAPALPVRVVTGPDTAVPELQLLSNGRYHVMVTHAGGGSSRWKDLAVTRWREDSTADNWGTFCYLRDTASGAFWSTAHQPTLKPATHYEAIFSEGRAEFRRRDFELETHTEIVVSPEDDIEVRRVRITNRSRMPRTIDVTSYAEVVLAPAAADALHPAFSNLFVQTEILEHRRALLCTRRPRSLDEHVPWMFHLMTVHGIHPPEISFETDRMRFIGRGNSVVAPDAMLEPGSLSNTAGPVLDPIAAIRHPIKLDVGATATIDMVTGAAETREAALQLVDKYQDRSRADRVFELTWTHSQVVLQQLNATESDSQLYGRLAGSVIYANASLRAAANILVRNRRGQSGLWGYAISGDLPIVLLQITDAANIELVRQLVQAHAYWRLKGLAVDLVIWNDDRDGYRQALQEQILGLIAAGIEAHVVDRPGGIFVRHAEQISTEDRVLFQSVARVIIVDTHGTLADQIDRRLPSDARVPPLVPTRGYRAAAAPAASAPVADLSLFNGIGGFSPDGREYVIAPEAGRTTPAPWVNVIANPKFGAVVSESGLGYTWSENAHLYRLTPWHNDPVCDPCGEALYLRDEETGHFWSPTAAPGRSGAPYVTRHGFGYTVFEHVDDGIHSELTVFVALDTAVKFFALSVSNQSGRARKLTATGYVEWVLGDLRSKSAMHVTTALDAASGAVVAHNPYNDEFSEWVAFFDVDAPTRSMTCDRAEFLGRNGTARDPAALYRVQLSGRIGAALDPCAALQVPFELVDGEQRQIVFRLGAASSADAAAALVRDSRGSAVAGRALEQVIGHWRHTLDAVQVETPDLALDLLTNGWLVYQTMACRMWARSGYYQSGGAFGFRDQLQDAMALVHAAPDLAREHIVLCASRQFVEGDVQHWWHPPSGRGVRTHCSDDFLWLALATSRYVLTTGDRSILDERAPFLEGRLVNAEDDSYYDLPGRADKSADLYQHCVTALLHALRFGVHGLPLIGSGDWNDGMSLVGRHGRGESVWLAFFLCHVLGEFAGVARLRDDLSFARRCETEAMQLRQRIEQHAWDGGWYRRAYFDDGSPLGSQDNAECQIDSVAQSWSVLSGGGDGDRSRTAMNAVYTRLVRRDDALIQLLDPPFDKSALDPGYIRGYVPGVRENGGQYTHGAIWTAMAFAALGDNARAWELTTMINPALHARTPEGVAVYKVEPYVVAADVYALAPYTGRGGWTWYTGSAGWMYRLIVESLLGLRREGDRLRLAPCLPPGWTIVTVRYRHRETFYEIAIRRASVADGESTTVVAVDGVLQAGDFVPLVDDRQAHRVDVRVAAH